MRQRYLVMHCTAGSDAASAISWLCNPAAKASAHCVIDRRSGAITQLVPCNRIAWHAGVSEWRGQSGVNASSIGIELDNAGKLTREGGRWVNWDKHPVPDDEVVALRHKHEEVSVGWHTCTEVQITAALELAQALHAVYRFEDVVGHEDISAHRKCEPGPAFPMASSASRILGRA